MNPVSLGGAFLALLIGVIFGYFIRRELARRRGSSVETRVARELSKAKEEAKRIVLEAQDRAVKVLEEANQEERRRSELFTKEHERITKRERALEERERDLERHLASLEKRAADTANEEQKLALEKADVRRELERISGLSQAEARDELFHKIGAESAQDLATTLKKAGRERSGELERTSRELLRTVIERVARASVSEFTTSTVPIPSEDLKGRIIGKEGRNIRFLERLTGVDLILDESPDTITISSFDPMRREIAKLALERLIADGRIQPSRIEEKVEEAKRAVRERMRELGERACEEAGVVDLPPELVLLLGRLAFRTSYGQNVLTHSVEMAHLAGMLASELGLRVDVAKKAALLHDIGKAIDHEVAGTHVEIGRKILAKYAVEEDVIKAMQSHHEEYPAQVAEAAIVNTADILSAARPGARRETLEAYIKRLEGLEAIANSFEGVEHSYAIQAGREVRVFVIPEKVDDYGMLKLARDIAMKIESELRYPGEIKVHVIRETRAVEYAR